MKRKAIIDIGTNAVRGVVYNTNSLGAIEIANTQFSHNFHNTPNKNKNIFIIMEHYKVLFQNLNVYNVQLMGTAAMRSFKTQELIQKIKEKYNFNIKVLSGQQEAHYVSKAINMSIKNANGVIADLGGGSLEISCIQNNRSFNTISIDIQNTNNISKTIKNTFDFQSAQTLENLYLVGGSFRLLVKQYAYTINYPPELISHYLSIPTQQLLNYIKLNLNNKHARTNNILIALIENLKIKNIIISNYGLKEGIHFSDFPNKTYMNLIIEKTQNITNTKIELQEIKKYTEIIRNIIPLYADQYTYIFKIALMFAKINKCVNYIHKSSVLSDWILKINIPLSIEDRIMLYVILQNIFPHVHENINHVKLISLLPTTKLYLAKIFSTLLNITYTIHGCFPINLNYNIFLCNKHTFIKCFNTLHAESFNKIVYSTKKLTDLIKKLYIKKSLSNYKYDNII